MYYFSIGRYVSRSTAPEFIHMFNDDERLGFICKEPPTAGDKFFYVNEAGNPIAKELVEITSIDNMGDKYKAVITNYSPVFYVMSIAQTVPLSEKEEEEIMYLTDKERYGEEDAKLRKSAREAKRKELIQLEKKSKNANRFGIS